MARVETIVVGGGISAGTPFTVGAIPRVVNSDPPLIADSIMSQTSATNILLAGSLTFGVTLAKRMTLSSNDTPANGALELGQTVTNLSNRGVAIGHTVAIPSSIFSCIYIGFNSNLGATANRNFIVIGEGNNLSGTGGSKCYIIGSGHSITSGNGAVLIGEPVTVSGSQSDIISIKAEAGVTTTTIGHSDVITIGGAGSTANNQCLIGGGSIDIRTMIIGVGDTAGAAGQTRTLRCSNESGLNVASGNFVLIAPLSTGNATPGSIIFQTGVVGGAGSTLQTATKRMQINGIGVLVGDEATLANFQGTNQFTVQTNIRTVRAAGAGTIELFRLDGGFAGPTAVQNTEIMGEVAFGGYDGAALAQSAKIAGVATQNWTGATRGSEIQFFTVANGATAQTRVWTMTAGGSLVPFGDAFYDIGSATLGVRQFHLAEDGGLRLRNQTDGAAAGAGTLTNAPAAGDPTFWLPISINGVVRHVPCW